MDNYYLEFYECPFCEWKISKESFLLVKFNSCPNNICKNKDYELICDTPFSQFIFKKI